MVCVYAWTMLGSIDLQKMPILAKKKNYLFRWSSLWSWRVCKKASHLAQRKPHAYIEKPTHPKRITVWCGFWSRGIIRSFCFENEQGETVTVNGNRYRAMLNEFLFIKIEEEDTGSTWFQQHGATCHTAEATLDVLRPVSMFYTLSAAELMTFLHLEAAIWHRWTICAVPSKISVTPTS